MNPPAPVSSRWRSVKHGPPSEQEIDTLLDKITRDYQGPLMLRRLLYVHEKLMNQYGKNTASPNNTVEDQPPEKSESPALYKPLLKALDYVQEQTWDYVMYKDICKRLNMTPDNDWIDNARRLAAHEYNRYETLLADTQNKQFSHDFGPEMVDVKLQKARLDLKSGDSLVVHRSIMSLREFVDDDRVLNMRLITDAAFCSLLKDHHQFARTLASKEVNDHNSNNQELISCQSCLFFGTELSVSLIYALSLILLGEYEEAVGTLLKEPSEVLIQQFATEKQVLVTASDLAVYIAFLALATFNRNDLKYLVDKDHVFAKYVDLSRNVSGALDVKQFIQDYFALNYPRFFQQIDRYSMELSTDLFIGPRFELICETIRSRAIIQYLKVFQTVSLTSYYQQFGEGRENGIENEQELQQELAKLIKSRELPYRIDHETNTVLYIKTTDHLKLFRATEKAFLQFYETAMLQTALVGFSPKPEPSSQFSANESRWHPEVQANETFEWPV